ncbi:hypothetical protein LTR37_018296 [Vermiconidia calcicola]|uniref:Uncharacterized protein n=1 Tax=Vermiconidia calcicola TaxID=1690605 RepID=A0ACC3MJ41_9PEZI|nr:hypothetical protein LTR37_018296 [Vermiconidia calcicola]
MSTKLSGPGKRVDHLEWNQELILGLDILNRDFKLTPAAKTAIFANVFEDHVRQCGLQGVKKTQLSAQWGERNKPGAWHLFAMRQQADSLEATLRRDIMKERIANAAHQLGDNVSLGTNTQLVQPASGLATPPASSIKRKRNQRTPAGRTSTPVYNDLDSTSQPRKRVRHLSAVVIPQQNSIAQTSPPATPRTRKALQAPPTLRTPQTPKSSDASKTRRSRAKSARAGRTTIWHQIRPGVGAWLTPEEAEEVKLPLVYPSEHRAHPCHTGLFYRLWDDNSQSPLDENGEFVAGQFKSMPLIPPPPPPTARFPAWNSIAAHLNRDPVHTCWISVSNHLVWIIRVALVEARRGSKKSICVIDPQAIAHARRNVFHAQPFHDALSKKRCFTDGAFWYHGQHEFLIYHKIPKASILKTVSVDSIFEAASNSAIGSALRLGEIERERKGYAKVILPALLDQQVRLTPKMIEAVAEMVEFFGLTPKSPIAHIAGMISDYVEGWGLKVDEYHVGTEWIAAASVFAQVLCEKRATLKDFEAVKMAFLDGVLWGNTRERNGKFRPEKRQRIMKRGKKIGLESPAKLLCDELDAVKLILMSFEKQQQRLLESGSTGQLQLEEGEQTEDEGIEDDMAQDIDEDVDDDVEGDEQIVWPNANDNNSDVAMGEDLNITYDSDDDGSIYEL